MSTTRQCVGAIEHSDVIEAEESAAEDVSTIEVFAVHPPREIEQEFLEGFFKEEDVAFALFIGDFIDAPNRPCVDGWIDVGEIPLVGR